MCLFDILHNCIFNVMVVLAYGGTVKTLSVPLLHAGDEPSSILMWSGTPSDKTGAAAFAAVTSGRKG